MKKLFLAAIMFGVGIASIQAPAAAGEKFDPKVNITGNWIGSFLNNGLPQPVFANVEKMKLGETGLFVAFSRPFDCKVEAEYGGTGKNSHIFYISDENCSRSVLDFDNGDHIKLRMTGNGNLSYELNIGGSVSQSVTLESQ